MTEDIVRVLRIVEYVGPRSKIERQISNSLHGTKDHGNGVRISAATIGEYPEILQHLATLEHNHSDSGDRVNGCPACEARALAAGIGSLDLPNHD